jgi:hypothetical protein
MKYFGWAVIILAYYLEVSTFVICRMSCVSSVSFGKYTDIFLSLHSKFLVEHPALFRWYIRYNVKVKVPQ